MTTMKKMCAAVLAALLLATGCAGNDKSWVYRSGDIQPPAGVYIYYEINGVMNAMTKLVEAGVEGVPTMTVKDVVAQTVEDQPASQWVMDDAAKGLKENIAIEQHFASEGVVMPVGAETSMAAAVEQEWANLGPMYEENGIARSSVDQVMMNTLKRSALFEHYYGADGKTPVPEEELKTLLTEDYGKFRFLLLPKAVEAVTDADGVVTATVEEQNATAKTQADDYLTRISGGEDFLTVIAEYEAGSAEGVEFAEHDAYSHLTILNESEVGSYQNGQLIMSEGFVEEALLTGAMAIPVGESAVVEDTNGYYILQRFDILEDPVDFTSLRSTLVGALKIDEFNGLVASWASELEFEVNQAALGEYKPEKLKLE